MKSGKYAGRIQASYEEGVRLGVSSTPTLLVGGRLYQGRLDSDAIAGSWIRSRRSPSR